MRRARSSSPSGRGLELELIFYVLRRAEADDKRSKKALKQLRKRIEDPLMDCVRPPPSLPLPPRTQAAH